MEREGRNEFCGAGFRLLDDSQLAKMHAETAPVVLEGAMLSPVDDPVSWEGAVAHAVRHAATAADANHARRAAELQKDLDDAAAAHNTRWGWTSATENIARLRDMLSAFQVITAECCVCGRIDDRERHVYVPCDVCDELRCSTCVCDHPAGGSGEDVDGQ